MKKLAFFSLFMIIGLIFSSCSAKKTEVSVAPDTAESEILKRDLTAIFHAFNPADFGLDSALILSDPNSDAKLLKLTGWKKSEGGAEKITTYISIKADKAGMFVPVSDKRVVSCASVKCSPCYLKDIWTEKAYCDCQTPHPGANDFECNMNEAPNNAAFKIPVSEDGLVYAATSVN